MAFGSSNPDSKILSLKSTMGDFLRQSKMEPWNREENKKRSDYSMFEGGTAAYEG